MDFTPFFIIYCFMIMMFVLLTIPGEIESSPAYEYNPDYSRYTEFWKDNELVGTRVGEARRMIDGVPVLSIVFDSKTKQEIKRTDESGCFEE